MRPRDRELALQLDAGLLRYDSTKRALPGIRAPANREAFIEQLLESIHRVKFVEVVGSRQLSERRADPNDELFDPLKAAILSRRRGDVEEAIWLVFLFVHFGKHAKAGWRYAREVYGRLGDGRRWDWTATSVDPKAFRAWLHAHQSELKRPGALRGFGNHRKYESLDAYSANGTGSVVESYVRWVKHAGTHRQMLANACLNAAHDPRKAFDDLYQSMEVVKRFGRTARFDYLTMIGKLGFAAVEPPSTYMKGSTGPVHGAQLLFGVDESPTTLDGWSVDLNDRLNVGMQVLEDALCNWQKSPNKFVAFRG